MVKLGPLGVVSSSVVALALLAGTATQAAVGEPLLSVKQANGASDLSPAPVEGLGMPAHAPSLPEPCGPYGHCPYGDGYGADGLDGEVLKGKVSPALYYGYFVPQSSLFVPPGFPSLEDLNYELTFAPGVAFTVTVQDHPVTTTLMRFTLKGRIINRPFPPGGPMARLNASDDTTFTVANVLELPFERTFGQTVVGVNVGVRYLSIDQIYEVTTIPGSRLKSTQAYNGIGGSILLRADHLLFDYDKRKLFLYSGLRGSLVQATNKKTSVFESPGLTTVNLDQSNGAVVPVIEAELGVRFGEELWPRYEYNNGTNTIVAFQAAIFAKVFGDAALISGAAPPEQRYWDNNLIVVGAMIGIRFDWGAKQVTHLGTY
jgi:hypothetical protein